jgi:hypothetical protein
MARYQFELTGRMPLLMHADDVAAADTLEAWRKNPENKGKSKAGDDRTPAWTYFTYLYTDGEHVVMPQENLMVALREAGARLTMNGKRTFKSASQSGLVILDEFCRFEGEHGPVSVEPLLKIRGESFAKHAEVAESLGFRLFVKRAKVGQAKHIRVRPRFDTWSVTGRIEVIDSAIDGSTLQQLFDLAGRYAGLGDWRPSAKQSPGPYGTFDSELKAVR